MTRSIIGPASGKGCTAAAVIGVQPQCRAPDRCSGWSCGSRSCRISLSQEILAANSSRHCIRTAVPDTAAVREVGAQLHLQANAVLDLARVSPNHAHPAPHRPMIGNIPDSVLIFSLAAAQALTLTGSLVGGHLARKRRWDPVIFQ